MKWAINMLHHILSKATHGTERYCICDSCTVSRRVEVSMFEFATAEDLSIVLETRRSKTNVMKRSVHVVFGFCAITLDTHMPNMTYERVSRNCMGEDCEKMLLPA